METLSFVEQKSLFDLSRDFFHKDNAISFFDGRKESLASEIIRPEKDTPRVATIVEPRKDSFMCRRCHLQFDTVEDQHAHFKSEWHKFNLKLEMSGLEPITEEEFLKIISVGELSGSSDEEDEDEDFEIVESSSDEEDSLRGKHRNPKVLISLKNNQRISLWRHLLGPKTKDFSFDFVSAFEKLSQHRKWTILMCAGGYFAGAVFDRHSCIQHKTFRRYTVRRKQGGSQSSRDQKSATSQPKSAGASIRRYNETKLREDIQKVLEDWQSDIGQSSIIFTAAPGNNKFLFLFPTSPIKKDDPRVRSIPFTTKRPTFVELTRVHQILSTVEFFDVVSPAEDVKPSQEPSQDVPSDSEKEEVKSEERESQLDNEPQQETEPNEILLAIEANDLEKVKELFAANYEMPLPLLGTDLMPSIFFAVSLKRWDILQVLLANGEDPNVPVPSSNFHTALHRVSQDGEGDIVSLLLEHGADPTIKGMDSRTPYDVSKTKKVRDIFRRYAGSHPSQWDYQEAHIPDALTDEIEREREKKAKEKKKKKQKQKKEKDKLRKEEEEKQKVREAEELEVQQIIQTREQQLQRMSDRERRALAAERRFQGTPSCRICYQPLPLVPFRREAQDYCSPECLGQSLSAKGK